MIPAYLTTGQQANSMIVRKVVVWGPDLFLRGGRGKRERRSGDSCSTSVCSWNVNREETVILEVIKRSRCSNTLISLAVSKYLILPPSY